MPLTGEEREIRNHVRARARDERLRAWGFTPPRLSEEERVELLAARRAQARLEREVPWGFSYGRDFILENPIAALCSGCGYRWTGRDAIRAPSLRGCSCFWCRGEMVALDAEAYAERLRTLHLHRVAYQVSLEFEAEAA